jgi:hypothetical protein
LMIFGVFAVPCAVHEQDEMFQKLYGAGRSIRCLQRIGS